jgi:hypothetical protein
VYCSKDSLVRGFKACKECTKNCWKELCYEDENKWCSVPDAITSLELEKTHLIKSRGKVFKSNVTKEAVLCTSAPCSKKSLDLKEATFSKTTSPSVCSLWQTDELSILAQCDSKPDTLLFSGLGLSIYVVWDSQTTEMTINKEFYGFVEFTGPCAVIVSSASGQTVSNLVLSGSKECRTYNCNFCYDHIKTVACSFNGFKVAVVCVIIILMMIILLCLGCLPMIITFSLWGVLESLWVVILVPVRVFEFFKKKFSELRNKKKKTELPEDKIVNDVERSVSYIIQPIGEAIDDQRSKVIVNKPDTSKKHFRAVRCVHNDP